MTDERSQEEVAGGFLRCRVGASTIDIPTLKMRDERKWKLLLAERLNDLAQTDVGEADFTDFGNPETLKAAATLINLPGDAVLELVVAYDKTEALGGREWIEENADSSELWTVLRRAFLVVFPFVTGIGSVVTELTRLRGMSQSSPESSPTNGPSLTGIAGQIN